MPYIYGPIVCKRCHQCIKMVYLPHCYQCELIMETIFHLDQFKAGVAAIILAPADDTEWRIPRVEKSN